MTRCWSWEDDVMTFVEGELLISLFLKEDGIKRCLEEAKQDIVILLADKGNATVVIDKEQYDGKTKELLEQGDYRKIKKTQP